MEIIYQNRSPIRNSGFAPDSEPLSSGEIKLNSEGNFEKIVEIMRKNPLVENMIPDFFPYREACIDFLEIPLKNLAPSSLYVLRGELEIIKNLWGRLLTEYGLDILKLPKERCLIEFFLKESLYRVGPPIIEVSPEDSGTLVIVDGLHRITYARELGYKTVNVVMVSQPAIPLPVLPVEWSEIKLYDQTPPSELKRRYRFSSLREIYKWIAENPQRFLRGFGEEPATKISSHFFYRRLI